MANADAHWSEMKEVSSGISFTFRFMLWATKHMPRFILVAITATVSFFFFLGAKAIRRNSRLYLEKVAKKAGRKKPSWFDCYKHVLCFSLQMLEKLLSWMGRLKITDLEKNGGWEELQKFLTDGNGAFLFCSHLGNMEMFRSLAGDNRNSVVNNLHIYPIVDFSGTSKFNALLRELNPELMDHVINANDIGIDSAIWIKEKLNEGSLIVIAGDRTSANNRSRMLKTTFLGEEAEFPEGAFTLASVIGAPVYIGAGIRSKDFSLNSSYEFKIKKANTQFTGSRKERKTQIQAMLDEYAAFIEEGCIKHPYQWYNFFNFWEKNKET